MKRLESHTQNEAKRIDSQRTHRQHQPTKTCPTPPQPITSPAPTHQPKGTSLDFIGPLSPLIPSKSGKRERSDAINSTATL